MDIIERLRFDAARCEAAFSKGVATNIEEAMAEIERLRAALNAIAKIAYELDWDGGTINDIALAALAGTEHAAILNEQSANPKQKSPA